MQDIEIFDLPDEYIKLTFPTTTVERADSGHVNEYNSTESVLITHEDARELVDELEEVIERYE